MHAAEDDMIFKVKEMDKIPKFNSPVFLENKTHFGTIDEIFGPINEVVRHYAPSSCPLSPVNQCSFTNSIFSSFYCLVVLYSEAQSWFRSWLIRKERTVLHWS